jgi:hypothetical protein
MDEETQSQVLELEEFMINEAKIANLETAYEQEDIKLIYSNLGLS